MNRRDFVALALTIVSAAGIARAADKPDPTGTWKWSVTFNDQKREMTLKLKLDGDKLTGSMVGRDGQDRPVDDPVFKDGEVSFSVSRERNGQKSTTKYKGKLDGDTIKGKAETDRNNETTTRDWEATREKKAV